jgi:hypothetical protein
MMDSCADCPYLKPGGRCGMIEGPEEPGENPFIENIYDDPPFWCPLGHEEPEDSDDEEE